MVALVERAGEPQREHGGGLRVEAEVGEHVLHQRLLGEHAPERGPVRRVVRRLGDCAPHQPGRAEHAVEARQVDHLDDRRDAAPLLADAPRPRAVERDLRRRVRAVAELVLEPVDPERVARAVGQDARQQVAREPARRLRQHEERVRHRRRAEPLVPVKRRLAPVPERPRLGGVRAHVRAALPLRHRHPAERPALLRRRAKAGVVFERGEARTPLVEQLRLGGERRDRRVRHRERAADAGLDLRQRREERGARDVRARPGLAPRRRVRAGLDAEAQQRVPGGVELDLVDPVAVAVVRAQDGRVLVRARAERERLPGAEQAPPLHQPLLRPAGALAPDALGERPVLRVEVDPGERRRLVHGNGPAR